MSTAPRSSPGPAVAPLTPRQFKQIVGFTLAAVALYLVGRWLPTGTNLQHADFRVAEGPPGSSLEFCDPANPQFLPVVAVPSPVETRLEAPGPVRAGEPTPLTLTLRTATGKAIGEVDLLESHTRKLHVMAVDPTLTDYQHLHPVPGAVPGAWTFDFAPQRAGTYRFFCDFTPAATARGLYASADLEVAPASAGERAAPVAPERPADPASAADRPAFVAERDGYVFTLEAKREAIRAREPVALALQITRRDGGDVQLGEVMGAFAHLVAFDEARSGFAHLHPKETDLTRRPDPVAPRLNFEVTIPESGRYVIWAQVVLDGRELYVPFWFDVAV